MLYSATVGNAKGPRPGIWDMLGRAKWYVFFWIFNSIAEFDVRDAWAKHKDLDTHEAKQMYVEALLKVCRYIL
jgi:acyl-CoA-binding protein